MPRRPASRLLAVGLVALVLVGAAGGVGFAQVRGHARRHAAPPAAALFHGTSPSAAALAAGAVLPTSSASPSVTPPPGVTGTTVVGAARPVGVTISGTPVAGGPAGASPPAGGPVGGAPKPVSQPRIPTQSLPDAIIGQQYSVQLKATGGTKPYAWSLLSSWLPAGLKLSSGGVITGLPTSGNKYSGNFSVRVVDGDDLTASAVIGITVTQRLGDINQDGAVNCEDVDLMRADWNTSNPRSDLNNDGVVNYLDLSILASHMDPGSGNCPDTLRTGSDRPEVDATMRP